jgi:hypothetical protein
MAAVTERQRVLRILVGSPNGATRGDPYGARLHDRFPRWARPRRLGLAPLATPLSAAKTRWGISRANAKL